jgi:hypothetical protein
MDVGIPVIGVMVVVGWKGCEPIYCMHALVQIGTFKTHHRKWKDPAVCVVKDCLQAGKMIA